MTTLYLATNDGPVVITRRTESWRAQRPLKLHATSASYTFPCVAADPHQPARVFCGMGREGVWRSDDVGANWQPVFKGIPYDQVTSIAVSEAERVKGFGVVYVGTEPSAIFRSENGGETWRNCEGLSNLPSASEWSFPPRPNTHHVRWIELDRHVAGQLYVAIEAGALIRSADGGGTWRDRMPGGPYDTHQLVTHPHARGRLWSAAGDGFFESDDAGDSWSKSETGLRFRYCWSVAIDPADPGTIVLSASPGPWQAHMPEQAESVIYRRTGNGPWQEVRTGLPSSKGTLAPVVTANPAEPGVFYTAANADLYRSSDAGSTWHRLDIEWPADGHCSRVHTLAAVETG